MGRRGAAGVLRGGDAMLTSLSLAAGCADAVGYLGLGQVFVADLTGDTVLLGLAIGQADGRGVLQAGTALAGFVYGGAVGAAMVEDTVAPLRISCAEGLYETSSNEVGAG